MDFKSGVVFLPCTDIERTFRFYHGLLGLPVAQKQSDNLYVFDTGRGYWGFCQYADGRAPLSGPKGICLSLNMESAEAVCEAFERIGELCPVHQPPRRHPVFPVFSCFLLDPDGYLVELQKVDGGF